jgi:hypothetical protein
LIDVKAFTAHDPTSRGVGRAPMIRIGAVFLLMRIKVGRQNMADGQLTKESLQNRRTLVSDPATLRFAVGVFDAWADVQTSIGELTAGGMAESAFSVLGLHRAVAPIVAHAIDRMSLLDLPFPGNRELVAGTTGPIADRLAAKLAGKADTLAAALGYWLIPRHAAQLEQAVAAGKFILWVQLFDNDDERRAYRSLLARSSNSVGVHDIVGT